MRREAFCDAVNGTLPDPDARQWDDQIRPLAASPSSSTSPPKNTSYNRMYVASIDIRQHVLLSLRLVELH